MLRPSMRTGATRAGAPRLTALAAVLAALLVAACNSAGATASPRSSSSAPATAKPTAASTTPAGSPGGSASETCQKGTPKPVAKPEATPLTQPPTEPSSDGTTAVIKTSLGDISIEVFTTSAPVASMNFINLAEAGFYDCVVFHRLVPDFVIQGGDPTGTGRGGPGYTIPDERVVGTYGRGIVAMARTAQPNSQGSQFFIVLDDGAKPALEQFRTYVIFGRVTSGMDVVDRIAAMPNSGEASGNQALEPLPMLTVTITRP